MARALVFLDQAFASVLIRGGHARLFKDVGSRLLMSVCVGEIIKTHFEVVWREHWCPWIKHLLRFRFEGVMLAFLRRGESAYHFRLFW